MNSEKQSCNMTYNYFHFHIVFVSSFLLTIHQKSDKTILHCH